MIPMSVIILTRDEEQLISRCIGSVCWADEVLVVDSGSTDRTVDIARSHGARVIEQTWLGWSRQRNAGASAAKHDWLFFVEADEIVTPELARNIARVFQEQVDPADGFSLDRRDDFLGILLPNQSSLARRRAFIRIYNRRCSDWDETMQVHERVRITGRSRPIDGQLLHCRGSSMSEMVDTLNRYATTEAAQLHDRGIRATWIHIALRPVLRFLWCYVVKQEFRLGARGLMHALMRATSEFVRYAKLWELQAPANSWTM